jgi:hypothetical protein
MPRLLALTILVSLGLAAPAGAAQRPRCLSAEGRTVALDGRARAYVTDGSLYACLRGERARIRLATNYDDEYVSNGSFGQAAVAGTYAAFEFSAYDISCKAACPPDYDPTHNTLTVVNLRTRARRATDLHAGEPFVLTRTGAAAWISRGAVLAFQRQGVRSLDPGPVQAESLEASRSRVTWLRDGVVQGAVLR